MDELNKIFRVINKYDHAAPHDVFIVLDATTGQNAIAQVEAFSKVVKPTGLIITKLDGTAKGGIVVSIGHRFGVALVAVGVGEGVNDLNSFNALDYAKNIVDI
jgi:fused signal recognition particle receptor